MFKGLGNKLCGAFKNALLTVVLYFLNIKPQIDINMKTKEESWNELYDAVVKLTGNNIVCLGNKVNCFVSEGRNCWSYMNIEKIRVVNTYKGVDKKPKQEVWVTINGDRIMKTISIPRDCNGEIDEIMDVYEVFEDIIELFSEKAEVNSKKADEAFANAALE